MAYRGSLSVGPRFEDTGHPVSEIMSSMTRDARFVPMGEYPADLVEKLRSEIAWMKACLKTHKAIIKKLRAEKRKK
jgi:hypothetical protein